MVNAIGLYTYDTSSCRSIELSSLAAANRSMEEYGIPESYCSRVRPCHILLSIRWFIYKMVKHALKAVVPSKAPTNHEQTKEAATSYFKSFYLSGDSGSQSNT